MNEKVFAPKVSIIIPVFNGTDYMKEAIDSALAQTYKNIEVIVVNDGSNDHGETDRIAKSYGEKIKYFYKKNGGVATALNLGIEKMQGEYFSWLSHDDLYMSDKIEKQIDFLSKQEDKTIVIASGYKVVDLNNKLLYEVNFLGNYTCEELERPLFALFRGAIHGCALLIHKSHFERVGIFDVALPTTQDYDLFFRIMRKQKIKFCEGLYVHSRSHEQQGSKKYITPHIAECNMLWKKMIDQLTVEEKVEIDGSLYLFYKNTRKFLEKNTTYQEVIQYVRKLEIELIRGLVQKSKEKTYLIEEFLESLEFGNNIKEKFHVKFFATSLKNKPRIAFFVGYSNEMGGLAKVLIKMADMLSSKYEVFLISFEKNNGSGYLISSDVHEIVVEDDRNYNLKLIPVLKLMDIDILIVSHNCMNRFLELYDVCKNYAIKSIAWNHEFYFLPYWNPQFVKCVKLRNWYLSHADVVLWLNSFSANVYGYQNPNGAIMPNPITCVVTSDLSKYHSKNIIAVGRFEDDGKGLTELLKSFSLIVKKCPDAILTVVGSYDLELLAPRHDTKITYKSLIKELEIPLVNLKFTGWCKDVEKYYQEACVQIMPSYYEGFGLVIIEAAVYGVPSIVFDGSGLEDLITNNENGFIVPQGDQALIAEKTLAILEDQALFFALSKSARRIAEKYDAIVIVGKWEALIEAVLVMRKNELNEFLKKHFMFPVKNKDKFFKQIIKEYEQCISNTICDANMNEINKLVSIENSFSWRITKPLRFTRKVYKFFEKNGIVVTVKKIYSKIK